MPITTQCSNTWCRGTTDRPGGLCAECQRKAEAQSKAQPPRWLWAGWDRREDNPEWQRKHKKETK
jgi:hypothetical protein